MQEQSLRALQQGATAITATRRLARNLRQEYNAFQQVHGIKAWESPQIITWQGWISDLWREFTFVCNKPKALLNPFQELILWERVLDSPESRELLQVHTMASAAQDAWRLANEWRLDLLQAENLGNEDVKAFLSWARGYCEICDSKEWIDQTRIADILKSVLNQLRLPSAILMVGFDEYSPQQEEFLEAFVKSGRNVIQVNPVAREGNAGAMRAAFPDFEREIEAAARWARALLETNAGKIGVVVAGLASRRNMVERIFRGILEPASLLPGESQSSGLINISAGNALSSYPMIQSALAILSLSPDENEWSETSSLLRSSYIRGSDTECAKRALLDAHIRRDGGSRIQISYLRRLCRERSHHCPLMDLALEDWSRSRAQLNAKQTAGQWSRTFSSMLEAFGWPGERSLSSAEYQTVQAWNELLSNFASADSIGGAIGIREAVSLAKRLAGQIMFQPETEHACVEILGALEASGLFFDHLWIAGLHDEAWPGLTNPNPFLPASMQREKGLPRCSPERELEFTARITKRLIASGSDVILSYPEREQDRELAPSPLIVSIPSAAPEDIRQWNGHSVLQAIQQRAGSLDELEKLVDEKGPPLTESSRQRGGTKVFQYQAGCPFRAFVELRLGAEKLEFPAPGLDPRQRGTLVHSVLEEIWKQLRTHSALCAAGNLSESVKRAVEYAMNRFALDRGAALPRRFAALERERLQQLALDWLELEKTRQPFEVVQPESELFAEVSGIRFKVKIDRIDRLPDDREVIIDYKTGMPNPRSWESDRPDEPQLPLYSTIHQNPLAGVLFAQIKTGQLRFLGLVNSDVDIPGGFQVDLAAQIREWRNVLEKLALNFRAGHAEVDPKNSAKQCHYCPLACMCRIAEFKNASDENEEEDA